MTKKYNIFVVLGPPGSGKGTQSSLLAEKLGYHRIVTGDLVRAYMKGTSPQAKAAKELYDKGIPQGDELIMKLFRKEIESLQNVNGVVLDTYPLSIGQAHALTEMLRNFVVGIFKVLFLVVDKEEIVKRIEGRKICSQCKSVYLPSDPGYNKTCAKCGGELIVRSDDYPEVARRRFEEYEKRNAPIKDYYREQGALIEINGAQSIEEVHQEIVSKLGLA